MNCKRKTESVIPSRGEIYSYKSDFSGCTYHTFNTPRSTQNGNYNFHCIPMKKNIGNMIQISLKFVARGTINNSSTLVHVMAWR